jgi:hypothetical protein
MSESDDQVLFLQPTILGAERYLLTYPGVMSYGPDLEYAPGQKRLKPAR